VPSRVGFSSERPVCWVRQAGETRTPVLDAGALAMLSRRTRRVRSSHRPPLRRNGRPSDIYAMGAPIETRCSSMPIAVRRAYDHAMPPDNDVRVLRTQYAWPDEPPDFEPAEWPLDGGGKQLVLDRIERGQQFLIVEIGCFLGSSIKQWLAASPKVSVIAIDPWEDGTWWADYARKHGRDSLAEQFERGDGPYFTFLSSMWDQRDRLIPVRGTSPEKLYELAALNIRPNLIYFDSDKHGADLEVAHALFPDAILTGDDWTWGREQGYPMRRAVKSFARRHNYNVIASRATWALTQDSLTASEQVGNVRSRVRDLARTVKGKIKATRSASSAGR
jgi:hypothetical protein